nr:PREDICTED: ferritin, heavy subunit-like [Lepisosteus oculatus]
MSEPAGKRLKLTLPVCTAHRTLTGTRVKHNFPLVVEESLCGVITVLMAVAYRLQALAKLFERDDIALPRIAAFFHQEAEQEQKEAESLLEYLRERGGQYCNKDIQKPGCEAVGSVLQALELMLAQWKEVARILTELCQQSKQSGDPHTASVVKKRFVTPAIGKIEVVGALLTNARRVGCKDETGFGEYLIDQLQKELTNL